MIATDILPQNPTPTKRRRRLSPEERRKQLLQIGIQVYVDMGLEGAGHANIARVANVSTATVFNYFPTRPILTQELIWEIKAGMNREFDKMIGGWDYENRSPKSRIYHMAEAFDRLIAEKPYLFKAFLMWGVSFNPELREEYVIFQNDILKRFEKLMGGALKNRGQARVFFGAAKTLAMMRIDNHSTEELTDYVVALTQGLGEASEA